MKFSRKSVFPEWNGFNPLSICILEGKYDTDADLSIGLHHSIHVSLFVRIERQHILDGCDAGSQALECTQQGPRIDFFGRARRILRRQRIEPPRFKRHLFERTFCQYIVGMIVGIHKAWQHKMIARVDDLHVADIAEPILRADANDPVAGDCNVGLRRVIPVRLGHQHPPAFQQHGGSVWNRFIRHRNLLALGHLQRTFAPGALPCPTRAEENRDA